MKEQRSLAQLINELAVLEELISEEKPISRDYTKTIHEAKQVVSAWELIGIASRPDFLTNL